MDTRSFRILLVGLLVLVIGSLVGVGILAALAVPLPAVLTDVVKVGLGALTALMVSPPAADQSPSRSRSQPRPASASPPETPTGR